MGVIGLRLDVIGVSLLNETPVVTLFLLLAEPVDVPVVLPPQLPDAALEGCLMQLFKASLFEAPCSKALGHLGKHFSATTVVHGFDLLPYLPFYQVLRPLSFDCFPI